MLRENCHFTILLLLLLVCTPATLPAGAASVITKAALEQTVKNAARISARNLDDAARIGLTRTLGKEALRHGDDIVGIVERGGLEVLEQGVRHGDDFWRICRQCTPAAARTLALHTDEFIPVVQRIGAEFLEFEVRHPGLGKRAVALYGDEAIKLLRGLPEERITQLLGYAGQTADGTVRTALLNGCRDTGGRLLDHLNAKRIMAYGLSASMVTAAWKTAGGTADTMRTLAENSPESVTEMGRDFSRPVGLTLSFVILLFAGAGGIYFYGRSRNFRRACLSLFSRRKTPPPEN